MLESKQTNQRFTSYDRSTVASLDYAVNRSYSSGQGRFTSVDPAQDGMNLYVYANNDPINYNGPSGLNANPFGVTYYVDGIQMDARFAMAMLQNGSTVEIPGGGSGTRWDPSANGGNGEFQFFRAYANGQSGWYNMQGVSITALAYLGVQDESGTWNFWVAGTASWSSTYSSKINSSGGSPLETTGNVVNVCDMASDVKEFSYRQGDWWKGKNGKWYQGLSGRGPNQFTGSRSIPIAQASKYANIGKFAFGIGTAISVAQVFTGETSPQKAAVDIAFGAAGTWGGPPGAILAGGHFHLKINLLQNEGFNGFICQKDTIK